MHQNIYHVLVEKMCLYLRKETTLCENVRYNSPQKEVVVFTSLRSCCIWLFCERMTNRAGELHRGHEPEGHISNLSSLLYGTRTKLFHIGFISFRGLKYTTHDRFRGNFPYE